MRTEYDLMQDSIEVDSGGMNLPDVMTLDLNQFEYSSPSTKYQLKESDVYRFDKLMISFYGSVSYYKSMVLLLNNIDFLDSSYINSFIFLPIKQDLDKFYLDNLVER